MKEFRTGIVSRSEAIGKPEKSTLRESEGGERSHLLVQPGAAALAQFAANFAQIQHDLRKDPYRVGLPPLALGARFAEAPMPFDSEFWIAEGTGGDGHIAPTPITTTMEPSQNSNGNFKGRIAANLSLKLPQTGFIGFFEAADYGTARDLVNTALAWLKARGVRQVYGPANFNTWLPYRFRVRQESSDSFAWEPINPPEYPLWFEEMGFTAAAHYHSDGLDGLTGLLEGTRKDYVRSQEMGYTIRGLDMERIFEKEIPLLYDLSMASFTHNFLFEAVPYEFFKELYVPVANKADMSLLRFVCDPEGKAVAYFFCFEDRGNLVCKTTAVHPNSRGLGLSNAALHSIVQEAQARGISRSITALMKTGIQSESYGKKQNLLWRHEYVLFGKEI